MKNKYIIVAALLSIVLITGAICFWARYSRNQAKSLILPLVAIPNLTNWLQSTEMLLPLGSNIQASADEMVAAIGDNRAQRFAVLEALGRNKREPNASVLLLRGLLSDKEAGIRMNAVNMLIMQKRFAQTARPEILQLTNDPDANVRGGAAFALRFVFPDNATPAPAKGGSSADESQPGQRK